MVWAKRRWQQQISWPLSGCLEKQLLAPVICTLPSCHLVIFTFFYFFFPPFLFSFIQFPYGPFPMAHLPVTASPVTCFPSGTAGPKSVVSLFPPSLNHGSTWITCRSCVTGTDLRLVHSWLTLSRNTELDGFRMFCSSLLSFILSLVAGN